MMAAESRSQNNFLERQKTWSTMCEMGAKNTQQVDEPSDKKDTSRSADYGG